MVSLIDELDRNGVLSRDRRGAIYNRRMVRDAKKIAHARKVGRLGGNPSLSKTRDNPAQDNPGLTLRIRERIRPISVGEARS